MKNGVCLICFVLILCISSCNVSSSIENEPIYLKKGDTYIINRKYLASIDDDKRYYGYTSFYEDSQIGLFENNTIERLDLSIKDDSLILVKPILSGETKLIQKKQVQKDSDSAYSETTTITTYFIIRD